MSKLPSNYSITQPYPRYPSFDDSMSDADLPSYIQGQICGLSQILYEPRYALPFEAHSTVLPVRKTLNINFDSFETLTRWSFSSEIMPSNSMVRFEVMTYKNRRLIEVSGNFRNGALADIAITTHGSDFYFAICAVMSEQFYSRII